MKRKESLLLMELLIMIAVFALTAGICLKIFAAAATQVKENAALDRSVIEAQNTAELLRHNGGDFAAAAQRYGGTWDGECWVVSYDAQWNLLPAGTPETGCCYSLTASPVETASPYLGKGQITVSSLQSAEQPELFALTVTWQEQTD